MARRRARSSSSPTSTRCCSRRATACDEPPLDEARPDRLLRPDRAGDAARTSSDRPLNLQRFPNGAGSPGFWQKDIPSSAPKWLTIWHETGFREREDRAANDHLIADRAATLCWLGNQAAFEIHAWTSTTDEPWTPDVRPDRHRPGHEDDVGGDARPRQALPDGARAPRRPRLPEARRAAAGSRRGSRSSAGATTYTDTSAWVEKLSRAIGGTRARARVVGVGEGRPGRQGAPRLHPERGDQDARRAVRGPAASRRARSPRRSAGRSSTTRRSPRTAGRSATLPARVAEVGDLWAGMQEDRAGPARALSPGRSPQVTSIRSTHFTHSRPRWSGATRRSGAPFACGSGPAVVDHARRHRRASSSDSDAAHPVTDRTATRDPDRRRPRLVEDR